jgi:formate-dependent nitrite reductase membrane component NrfD
MNSMGTLATQDIWTWWIAAYLYMGGLGAGTLVVTFLTDMYMKPHRQLVLWGAFSGVVMLGLGSLLLFTHLLHHSAVINVINPLVLINQPHAWIAWGTQFILWMMVWGVLYALPYMRETPFLMQMPILGRLLDSGLARWISGLCRKNCVTCGWMATINGIGTVVYTGLLLQSFPAVALWHNPGVPLLFTVSAFSTAMAFLLIALNLFISEEVHAENAAIERRYELLDLILISTELVILFSFFFFLQRGSESAARSSELLWSNPMWIYGFIGLGLIVPFLIELKTVVKGGTGKVLMVSASMLVLIGGYLLRHYFLLAGVYAYPW